MRSALIITAFLVRATAIAQVGDSGEQEIALESVAGSVFVSTGTFTHAASTEQNRTFSAPDTPTLRDHLNQQLTLTAVGERDRALVAVLIDALDEDGYLTQPLAEIAALFPPQAEVDAEELGIALRHLQNLEPAGVGARSPAECLVLQLRALGEHPAAGLALQIGFRQKLSRRHVISCAKHSAARVSMIGCSFE